MAERRFQLTIAGALLLAGLLVTACGTVPVEDGRDGRAGEPAAVEKRERELRPVSRSLLQQSREQRQDGNYAQAAATLERAIRIDPGEPETWLELARLRYAENNWQQAEQLARKAGSLAAADSPARSDASRLIAAALRMQGRQR